MSTEYSATEAAGIIAESGTAPKSWCDYVHELQREAAEIVGRQER